MKLIRLILPISILLLLVAGYFLLGQRPVEKQEADVKTAVQHGEFTVKVSATGELQAKRSEKVRGPSGMRAARIYQTSITDMIPEGTLVKAGEYVATLDKTELDTKIKEILTEMEKIETQLEQTKIDTAIDMREIRDKLINLKFAKEEKKLQVEQSRYEPQSVIQQTKIEMQKTEREYEQLLKKYELTKIKSQAQVGENLASLKQNTLKLKQLQDLGKGFRITAPKDGMLIYARNWNGKIGPGSQVSSWDPVVAELPDLSDMVSKTFVNEVDISKVKKGQDVNIGVDAFPDRSYTGTVVKVANIGEQLKGYDSKVFEVIVQVNETDSILRPAMTTSIEIITDVYEAVTYVPLEAIFTDSLTFVYKETQKGVIKQEVITGGANDNQIIIDYGLEEGETVYLNTPKNLDPVTINLLDATIKEEIKQKQLEDKRMREAAMLKKMKAVKNENIRDNDSGGGSIIIF